MAGLLGGVLPAIYSGADQLKRQVYGLLTNPQEQAQRAAQSLLQSRAERQALMARTFANPERPFQVTDQAGLAQLGTDVLTGELGIAPIGMTKLEDIVQPYLQKGVDLSIYESRSNPNKLTLSKIEVPKSERNSGIGTDVMNDLTNFADTQGKTITLSPSKDFGATSVNRLKEFYKRFGFVENKGRNKDYSISETMYRLPSLLDE
jgi:GNAT superfamily N-acetyltransferase